MAHPEFRSISGPDVEPADTVTWTVNKPDGAVEGDLVLVILAVEVPYPGFFTSVFDTAVIPSGFEETVDPVASNWPHGQAVYHKVLGAGEPSSWTWTLASPGGRGIKRALAYSSVDTDNPINAAASLLAPSDPTPPNRYTTDEITTTQNDCMLLSAFATVSGDSFSWLIPGMVERGDLFSAFVTSSVAAEREPIAGPGQASMPAGTYSVTGTAGSDGVARGVETALIAIAPAPTAPAAPVNMVDPIASGNATDTFEVSVTDGEWTGDFTPVLFYQWRRGPVGSAASYPSGSSTNISGATSSTYLLTEDDVDLEVFCVVQAVNGAGTVNAASNGLYPVEPAPEAPDAFLMTDDGLVPTRGRLMTSTGLFPPP